jgi:hypothetical protein
MKCSYITIPAQLKLKQKVGTDFSLAGIYSRREDEMIMHYMDYVIDVSYSIYGGHKLDISEEHLVKLRLIDEKLRIKGGGDLCYGYDIYLSFLMDELIFINEEDFPFTAKMI